jgi:predicted site-specific integrase-resolvase
MTNDKTDRLAMRARDAAKALGISPRLLSSLTSDGSISCVRLPGRRAVLYPTTELRAWLSCQATSNNHSSKESVLND